MYYEVGIQKLSENQLSKLRNGHPVRVKLGNHHKICLSVQQLKKLNTASKKGSASTISFDPYQLEAHGSGILGNIGIFILYVRSNIPSNRYKGSRNKDFKSN